MPSTPCRVVITPDVDVDTTIYTEGGHQAPAYTTENGSTPHTYPVAVPAGTTTTFWLTTPGVYSISTISNSTEIAGPAGSRLSVGLDYGGSAAPGIRVDLPTEIQSLGASSAAIAAEATARAAADTAEATARAAADTTEATARASGDTSLTAAIAAEAVLRAAAVTSEATTRSAADTAEAAARAAAVAVVQFRSDRTLAGSLR